MVSYFKHTLNHEADMQPPAVSYGLRSHVILSSWANRSYPFKERKSYFALLIRRYVQFSKTLVSASYVNVVAFGFCNHPA